MLNTNYNKVTELELTRTYSRMYSGFFSVKKKSLKSQALWRLFTETWISKQHGDGKNVVGACQEWIYRVITLLKLSTGNLIQIYTHIPVHIERSSTLLNLNRMKITNKHSK